MDNVENKQQSSSFESIDILISRWRNGTLHEILDDWRWIFSYSIRYKGAIAFYLILGILSTTLGLASSIAGKYLIDIITGHEVAKLWVVIVVMVGSGVFSLVFNSIVSRISVKLAIDINNDIQSDIFDKIVDADWMEINKYSNGDVLNRFTGDIGTVSGNAINWLPSIIISIYQFVATFFVILHYDTIMALLAFAAAPFMLLVSRAVISKQREYGKKVREMSSKVMTFEVETFYNIDTIKSFGITDQYSRKLKWWQKALKKLNLDYNLFSIKTNIYMSVVGMLVTFTAFGYCLWLLWSGAITYGTMTLFLQQRGALSGAFNRVLGIVPSFLTSSVSAHRIRELVQLPKEVHVQRSSELDKYIDDGFSLRLNDVDFSYVSDKQVLVHSSFEASPGEIVAIIGPSGEGKTTLLRMILGLIRPQGGKAVIRTAKKELEIPMNADARHLFSYVPQGNNILSGTIAENMRMAKEDATDEEIIEALRIAQAWDFVKVLSEGINSPIGERGRGFSEGQTQRLAIARAILRDAPIVLLDEATSALDVTTERAVLRNIIQQRPNKTIIVTTHRPTVLNMCKRVYRVVNKKVTELDVEQSAQMAMDF